MQRLDPVDWCPENIPSPTPPTQSPQYPSLLLDKVEEVPRRVEQVRQSDSDVEQLQVRVDQDKGEVHSVEVVGEPSRRNNRTDDACDAVCDISEKKMKINLPRKRKISQEMGVEVTPDKKKRGASLAKSGGKKSEKISKSKLNLNNRENKITNHFKPASIADVGVGGARHGRVGNGDTVGGPVSNKGGEVEAVLTTCAGSGADRLVGEKTMQLVNCFTIGRDMSAAGNWTNTGAGDTSAGCGKSSLGQCAQLKEK